MLGDHRSVAVATAVPPVPDAALAQHWFGIAPPALPTALPGAAGGSMAVSLPIAGPLSLRGLVAGGPQPLAIIDVAGTSWQVQVGERFADRYTLESISSTELVIDDGGQRRVLSLPAPEFGALPEADADVPGTSLAPQGALVGQSPNARAVPRSASPAVVRGAGVQNTGRP